MDRRCTLEQVKNNVSKIRLDKRLWLIENYKILTATSKPRCLRLKLTSALF